jgi:hypothetical protein
MAKELQPTSKIANAKLLRGYLLVDKGELDKL